MTSVSVLLYFCMSVVPGGVLRRMLFFGFFFIMLILEVGAITAHPSCPHYFATSHAVQKKSLVK